MKIHTRIQIHIHTNTHTNTNTHSHSLYIYILAHMLILTMRELRQWPSIAGMSPQSHCGDEEDIHKNIS